MTPEEQAAADAAAAAAAAAGTPPAGDAPPPAGTPPAAAADTSKTPLVIPRETFNNRLAAERARGAKDAQAKLDGEAQELGYRDHAAMMSFLKTGKGGKNEPPVEEGKPAPKVAPVAAASPKDRKWRDKAEEERKARGIAERKAREADERNQALVARHGFELRFAKAGVNDTDYAISLLEREMATMTDAQVDAFDETAWLDSLKKNKKSLFDEPRRQAIDTTGATDGKPPPAGAPPPTKDKDGNPLYRDTLEVDPKSGRFKMSQLEVDAELRKIMHDAQRAGSPVIDK